jgi:tetratricopeptide (TPR) repeat protein
MTLERYKEFITEIDSLTKQGKRALSLQLLEKVRKTKPPSEITLDLAKLAHRNSAFILAMRILYPEIKAEQEGLGHTTNEVLATYANSLLNIGALDEARACTSKASSHPEILIVRAFIDFSQWKYLEAIPKLKDFIHSTGITSYRRLVGQVNLAASYISVGFWKEARALLDFVIDQLKTNKDGQLLLGNCYELYAQIEIQEKNFIQAKEKLELSYKILSSFHGRYLLYVKKWNSVLELIKNPENHNSLLQVRSEAQKLKNWETIRDCDFHLARLTNNRTLMNQVFLGTPYKDFRKRLTEIYQISVPNCNTYEYCPGDVLSKPQKIEWDLKDHSALLKSGQTGSLLIQTLTADIYKPPRMGQVFFSLYPTERFNPFTSPPRVRNSVFRFNEWSHETKSVFRIEIKNGDFFISGPTNSGLRIKNSLQIKSKTVLQLRQFRQIFGGKSFSSSDLAKTLDISIRSANNLIKFGCEKKILKKLSASRSSRFLFSSNRVKD